MTCNLTSDAFINQYLCNPDGTCRTPDCPYVNPGKHPTLKESQSGKQSNNHYTNSLSIFK